jgi:hypothetical protein
MLTAMGDRIAKELGKFTLALLGVSGLLLVWLFVSAPRVDLLDYGNAFHFYNSTANRLYIGVTGRARVDGVEYVALANHPREDTFNRQHDAYSNMIEQSGGASTISFLMASDGSSVIERRYQAPRDEYTQHSCRSNPYGRSLVYDPPRKWRFLLDELHSKADILDAAVRGRKLYAVVTYKLNGRDVTLDFPAALVNINPAEAHADEQWQLVSERLPLYVGGDLCEGIREGHAALRRFDGPFDVTWLCRQPDGTNDFACSRRIAGRARVFAAYL